MWVLAVCLLASIYAHAQSASVSLGDNVSSALHVQDTVTATVTDGNENYFRLSAENLPATVYYISDSVFGPVPGLVNAVNSDTLDAVMVSVHCRMGWKWELPEAGEEEEMRYLYFSAHESNAVAEIMPTVTVSQPTSSEDYQTVCDSLFWNGEWRKASGDYTYTTTNAAGSDSTATLHLTVLASTAGDTVAVECGSFSWHGATYTVSGTYNDTLIGANSQGCDSIVTLYLTVNRPTSGEETQAACGSYEWHGQVYSQTGNYERHFVNAAGCDSTAVLHLTVYQPTSGEETQAACISYEWHGVTYTESGTYRDTLVDANSHGCDSIVTLYLTVNQPTSGEETQEACVSYEWHGVTYTESGTYRDTLVGGNSHGCDSIVTLYLTVNQPTSGEETQEAYVSYKWNGTTYTESGTYRDTLTDSHGCDSVVTLYLTIKEPEGGEETQEACGSYEWHDVVYTESGDYTITLTNEAGLDSMATLHLTIHPHYNDTLPDVTGCNDMFWEGYEWGDTTIMTSGTYTRRFTSVHGCDSIVTLTVTVRDAEYVDEKITAYDSYTWRDGITYTRSIGGPIHGIPYAEDENCDSVIYSLNLTIKHLCKDTVYDTICPSELPYEWYGQTCSESGGYTSDTIIAAETDTVHTLVLTVKEGGASENFESACESYEWNDSTYTESGTYTFTTAGANGCDSVATLYLTILEPTAGEESQTVCNSYTWNGVTYTEPGDYTFHTVNAAGCDSTATLHLTISETLSGEESRTACGPYEWHGTTYTESGDYTFDTVTAAGCDSVATLHLTISESLSGEETQAACLSYEWHGTTYTESGDYTFDTVTAAGCDSTATLHLTINRPTSGEETQSACVSYVWYGQTYTASGDYTYTTSNAAGCDSTVTLHLTIKQATSSEMSVERCEVYVSPTGQTYTASGNYTETLTNAAGCDSVVTLHLTIVQGCGTYDTVYFCAGQNTEHDELVSDGLVYRYRAYRYESPAEWDYMEGAVVTCEQERMLVDLNRAERNLYEHYVDDLTPVKSVVWSYRPENETVYQPLQVTEEQQWIPTGTVAVVVRFICGQMYTGDFVTDVRTVNAEPAGGRKVLVNGQIVIVRGGEKYTILGSKIE